MFGRGITLARMAAVALLGMTAHPVNTGSYAQSDDRSRRRKFYENDVPVKGTEADLLDKGFHPGSSKRAKRRKGKS